jgi:hypothetical protein
MNNSYFGTFQNMIADISNDQRVVIKKSDIKYYTERIDGKSFKQFSSVKCDDEIMEFYSLIEKIELEWLLKEDLREINYLDKESDIIGGELNILSLNEMIKGLSVQNKKLLPAFDFSTYLPFDYIAGELAICFRNENDFISNKLYMANLIIETNPVNLGIGVREYFNIGRKNYFFFGWQKALLKSAKEQNLIRHYLDQLF